MAILRFWPAALALALLCVLGGGARAASPAASPTASPGAASGHGQGLTVMVVDVQALMQKSKAAQMVRGQIEHKRAEYTKEISRQERALRAERDSLQRQQGKLSPKVLNEKGREFQQKVNELDRSVQSKRQALERSSNAAIAKIQDEMLKIIDNLAKERKANLVLPRADLLLFDPSFDVTDQVLHKLDEKLPKVTVDFSAPETETKKAPAHKSRRK